MPVDGGDYDVEPVDHNPFGSMAASPNDYDVAPVDHDPFAAPPDEFRLASRQPQPSGGIGSDARYPVAPPLGWDPPPLSPGDRDSMIKTVYGEARGEPEEGQAGVAHAILNRVRAGGYGQGIEGVVKAPAAGVNPRLGYHEFSPWNTGRATEGQPAINTLQRDRPEDYARIGRLVDKVYSGTGGDPTYGATHYYGVMPRPPSWAPALAALNREKIGNTTFVGRDEGPGRSPTQLAGYQEGGGVTDLGEVDPGAGEEVPDAPPPMTSADILAKGGLGSISAGSFAPSDQARQLVQMGLEGAGMNRGAAQDISSNFATEAGALPISGQILSGADALYHGSRGEYGEAAASGLGAMPDVGPLAHGVGAMFIGPMARNVDREALSAAKSALAGGEHQFDVWGQHMWEPDAAGNWRTEIADPAPPDIQKWGNPGDRGVLSDYYDHPELYANYPELANTPVQFWHPDQMHGAIGGYHSGIGSFVFNPAAAPHEINEVLPHEVQHRVAEIEGWPPGTNPNAQRITPGSPAMKAFQSFPAKERKAMGREEINRQSQGMAYLSNAGEISAFNTGKNRLGYDIDWRRANPPPTTENVNRGFQWWGGPGDYHYGQDIEPRATGGGVIDQNSELRRRLALLAQPRHGFQAGGVTDLGSDDNVDMTPPDTFAETGVGATPDEAQPQPDLTEAARAGKLGTISSYTPSWSERIRTGTESGLESLGAQRDFAEDVGQNLSDIAGYTPIVGNVLSGNEAVRSYESGHPYLAALHAAAAVPIPGVKSVTKVAENVAENVAEKAAVPSAVRIAKQVKARGRGAQPLPQETSVFAPEGLPESSGLGGPAPASALGGWAKAGDPEVVWNPERRGWDLTGRKIEKGFEPTTLFDRPEPGDVPPVPQFQLDRYTPPRGVPQRTLDITSDPVVRQQHLALIRRGMDMGALAWYNAEPIRQRFIQELGDNQGKASFQNFMDMVASTSPQQKVPENVRAASYYYWLNQNKLPVPERGNLPRIAYGGGQPVGSPYGGLSLWQMNVNRVMNEGGLNPLENPKPPSFSQNLQGNWAPATVDMHAVLAPAILARHPDWLTKDGKALLNKGTSLDELAKDPKWWDSSPGQNEYPTLERYYQSLANELGITPAQAQAASWVGAGHITGLGSDGNKIFNNFFEDRIANTAAKTGKPPQEVLSNFIRGKHPLLSVAPLGAVPFAASALQRRQQDTDRPAED